MISNNPIVFLVALMLGSVILLIGAAVLGIDRGVLGGMARTDYARGLITYLFAVVTIGTAVILVVFVLSPSTPVSDTQFQRGKEVLSLLLGVFGTIVGYYFGTESSKAGRPDASPSRLTLSRLHLAPPNPNVGDTLTVHAIVSAGVAPYRFAVSLGSGEAQPKEFAGEGGWISTQLNVRELGPDEPKIVRLVVRDASGQTAEQSEPVKIRPNQ